MSNDHVNPVFRQAIKPFRSPDSTILGPWEEVATLRAKLSAARAEINRLKCDRRDLYNACQSALASILRRDTPAHPGVADNATLLRIAADNLRDVLARHEEGI